MVMLIKCCNNLVEECLRLSWTISALVFYFFSQLINNAHSNRLCNSCSACDIAVVVLASFKLVAVASDEVRFSFLLKIFEVSPGSEYFLLCVLKNNTSCIFFP